MEVTRRDLLITEAAAIWAVASMEVMRTLGVALLKENKEGYAYMVTWWMKVIDEHQGLREWLDHHNHKIGQFLPTQSELHPVSFPVETLEELCTISINQIEDDAWPAYQDLQHKEWEQARMQLQLGRKAIADLIGLICGFQPLTERKNSLLDNLLNPKRVERTASIQAYHNVLKAGLIYASTLYDLLPGCEIDEDIRVCMSYKWLFVYLNELPIGSIPPNGISEPVWDAYRQLVDTTNLQLNELLADDLWILGNPFVEKFLCSNGMEISLQKRSSSVVLRAAKLNALLSEEHRTDWIQAHAGLLYHDTFPVHYQESKSYIRAMYNRLDQCIAQWWEFYESYEVDALVDASLLEPKKQFQEAMNKIGICGMEVRAGDSMDVNCSQIVEYVETENVELDHTIHKVYRQGLRFGKRVICRSWVSVYQFHPREFSPDINLKPEAR